MKNYRAWHKEEKRMFEVCKIHLYSNKVSEYKQEYSLNQSKFTNVFYGEDEVIVMEGTGVLDCNNKEIFICDIIMDNFYKHWSVFYSEHFQRLSLKLVHDSKNPLGLGREVDIFDWIYPSNYLQIIGNIYEGTKEVSYGK